MFRLLSILVFTAMISGCASSPSTTSSPDAFLSSDGQTVSKEMYPRAETSRQMLTTQAAAGGVNKFIHLSVLTPTDNQSVVRMNRDAYYSKGVVDVSQGATITMPDVPDGTYISMQPVTEDHRPQPMSYGGGTFELATHTGTHLIVILRFDSRLTSEEVANYQSQVLINANGNNLYSAAPLDRDSFKSVEDELKADMGGLAQRYGLVGITSTLFSSPTNESRGFYKPEINQTAAAVGWGGALAIDNIYETSPNYAAEGCHQMTFEDPENRDFWSVTVYNDAGFMFDDDANMNSYGATPNDDGTFTVSFGCDETAPNRIPVSNDSGKFSVTVRHYGPSERVSKEGYRLTPFITAVD